MAENSSIEWTDHTFNPWIGCTKVGPGCDYCYAEIRDRRKLLGPASHWGPSAPRHRTSKGTWGDPLRWQREAATFIAAHGRRPRVFCASMADVFDNEVDPAWRADLFALIRATPDLDWLLLTKRIGNAAKMAASAGGWPANIWLGATIVNQAEADRDIPKLLATAGPAVRFLSMEPLLGPVDLTMLRWEGLTNINALTGAHGLAMPMQGQGARIDWIIVGGEAYSGARPMHPDWARSIRDQCEAAGVPMLFKQWGEHDLSYDRDRDDPDWRRCGDQKRRPGQWLNLAGGTGFHGERVHYAARVGKKAAGRLLDGIEHNGFPRR